MAHETTKKNSKKKNSWGLFADVQYTYSISPEFLFPPFQSRFSFSLFLAQTKWKDKYKA